MSHYKRVLGRGLNLGSGVGLRKRQISAAAGPPPGPTPDIIWDLEGAGALPGTSTFTRSDNKWYRNGSGVWVSAGVNIQRFHNLTVGGGEQGLLFEPPVTKLAIQRRDFTNAAWVKTNITAAKDETGIDGVANSCSTLTATAANGTALQVVTSASSNHVMQAFVSRKTGTGTIEITINGGTQWEDITSSLTSNIDNEFSKVAFAITDPEIGFRIVTSGDEIVVDCCDVETGLRATTPFVQDNTGSETRSSDDLTDSTSLDAAHSMMVDATVDPLVQSGNEQATLIHFPPSATASLFLNNSTQLRVISNTLAPIVNAASTYEGERHKFAFSVQTNEGILVDDEDNDDTDVAGDPATGTLRIGSRNASSRWWHSVIHRVEYFSQAQTLLELKNLVTGGGAVLLSLGYSSDLVGYSSDVVGYVV